ncbi:transcriptional regulator, LysR family [Methylobacillus rhizosphaerae]|uniref:Transcriptional regulator, LysR family n=1 Tax=Methylobacillus rhizosphaerae TaxID=551994 RepID=A0A238XXB6_9PROT|nr:transcriptional activator NhaR [Methylobacillus rhizosphaerae]SNR63151.1 transcriptional regulator, LysR family [Methylobacillus rhizosphaerae]
MNYKQLNYFWAVAKAGSLVRASEQLGVTSQTLSGQISLLEADLNVTLFKRAGRGLELTDAGRIALPYAERIFETGSMLEETLQHQPRKRPRTFNVGIAEFVPKSIAYHLLSAAMELEDPIKIVCREDNFEALLAQLAIHKLDIVLADRPMPGEINITGISHKLGESGTSFFATAELALKYPGQFPDRLHRAPMLVMGEDSLLQGQITRWLNEQHIAPNIVGEFDDSALMKAFGMAGTGFFTASSIIASEIEKEYGVIKIAETDEFTQHFYAISVPKHTDHPAVVAVNESADNLFLFNKNAAP